MAEPGVTPTLPTSGQALGAIIKPLGIMDRRLQSKTAQRYFSGCDNTIVKESSRQKIIESVAKSFIESEVTLLHSGDLPDDLILGAMVGVIEWHVSAWDEFRLLLHRRITPIQPSNLPRVWASFARLASIDLSLRISAALNLLRLDPDVLETLELLDPNKRGQFLIQSVRDDCGPLDMEYFYTLGAVQRNLGYIEDALASFETASQLDPQALKPVISAGIAAYSLDDKRKLRQYAKKAQHISGDEALFRLLDQTT